MINARMRINAAEKVSEGQRWAMFLMWKKVILVMWLIWWSHFSWSKKIPILWVCVKGEPTAVIKGKAEVVGGFGEGCGVSDNSVQFITVHLKTVFILKKGLWLQQVP